MKIIDGIGSAIMWVLEKLGIIESKKIEVVPNEVVSTGLNESNNRQNNTSNNRIFIDYNILGSIIQIQITY